MKTITRHIDSMNIDIEYIIGGNANENHEIIDNADPDDLWFHISGHPSCHVIGKVPSDIAIDKNDLLKIAKQGAVVCKESSSEFKKQKNVEIDYTKVKFVTKMDTPGMVNVTNVKKIKI
jgi:predicted ribosome quality control (RQC) complex YloA/Tae2 family protein